MDKVQKNPNNSDIQYYSVLFNTLSGNSYVIINLFYFTLSVHLVYIKSFNNNNNNNNNNKTKLKKTNSMVWVCERTIPTERPPLVGRSDCQRFADRGCHMVSVTDPYGRILDFRERSHYFSIK
jgi:hypothetical protein